MSSVQDAVTESCANYLGFRGADPRGEAVHELESLEHGDNRLHIFRHAEFPTVCGVQCCGLAWLPCDLPDISREVLGRLSHLPQAMLSPSYLPQEVAATLAALGIPHTLQDAFSAAAKDCAAMTFQQANEAMKAVGLLVGARFAVKRRLEEGALYAVSSAVIFSTGLGPAAQHEVSTRTCGACGCVCVLARRESESCSRPPHSWRHSLCCPYPI